MLSSSSDGMTRTDIESMLRQVLVPVDPDQEFVRRLRANLVRYHGSGIPTIWAVVAGLGIGLVVLVAVFSLVLRLFLGLLSALGLLERRPVVPHEGQTSAA